MSAERDAFSGFMAGAAGRLVEAVLKIALILMIADLSGGCSVSNHADYMVTRNYELAWSSRSISTGIFPDEAQRIVFLPPDACAMGLSRSDRLTTFGNRIRCVDLMTELELEALRIGFEVIPWRTLEGSAAPLESARAHAADIILVVDEREVGDFAKDLKPSGQRVEVREISGRERKDWIEVENEDIHRVCELRFQDFLKTRWSMTQMSVEAIDLTTRRSVWRFENDDPGFGDGTGQLSAVYRTRVRSRAVVLRSGGVAALLMGALFPLVARGTTRDEDLIFANDVLGLSLAVTGGLMLALDGLENWPDPGDTMCNHGTIGWVRDPVQDKRAASQRLRRFAREAMVELAELRQGKGLP